MWNSSGWRALPIFLAIAFLNAAAVVVCPQPAASPAGYDIFATLPALGPHQQILLDSSDAGLVLTFDADRTTLHDAGGKRERLLSAGPAAHPGEIHIKRRMPLVEVLQDGKVLLRTWSRRRLAGQVAPSDGAGIEDFQVQPIGEIYFADEFFNPDGSAAVWEPLNGAWKVGIYRDALIQRDHGDKGPIGASWYEIKDATRALSVVGYDFWDSYYARVAVCATPDTRAGLAFYAQDAHNYVLLSVRGGEAEGAGTAALSIVRNDEEQILAREDVTWRPGTWYELAVEAVGERVSCRVADREVFATALPAFTGGPVGLFADGSGTAKFDDVLVHSVAAVRDGFERAEMGECWRHRGGTWTLADGQLHASSKRPAYCLRVSAGGAATSVATQLTPQSGAAGLCLNWTRNSGYLLKVAAGQYALVQVADGEEQVLASGAVTDPSSVPLRLSYLDGRLRAVVGDIQETVYDFDAPEGACGLFADGRAQFDDFELTQPQPPGAEISFINGRPLQVPAERHGQVRPLLGYYWLPRDGHWSPAKLAGCDEPGLRPKPRADKSASLWYFQPCPGDAIISATNCLVGQGTTIGLAIACAADDLSSGYALEASASSPLKLKLLRVGKIVAENSVAASDLATPGPQVSMSLWRDGDYIVGKVGDAHLAYKDDQPLAGTRCCAYVRGSGTVIGKLALGHRRAHYYAFREVETDWQPAAGQWLTHSGMACIAWDYWLTARAEPEAMSYNLRRQPHDLQVDFWVSEYTEGFANGHHQHYPYHDISLVTCAHERDKDSGYRFLIGGEGGRVTRLLRLGEVVAETRDSRLWITMGGHCNNPRAIHVVVSQSGGKISLRINDVEALEFTDPEPLPGGFVGIGAANCTANFRDFWMAPAAD